MSKFVQWLLVYVAVIALTACGGGGGSGGGSSAKGLAIAKITAYAQENGASSSPTIQDYKDAGVSGIDNQEELDKLNQAVSQLGKADVDTTQELLDLAKELGLIYSGGTTDPDQTTLLSLGSYVSGSILEGSWKYYKLNIHDATIKIILDHLSADLDLYVKIGSKPTDESYACASSNADKDTESCIIEVAGTQDIYIGVNGYRSGNYRLGATINDITAPEITIAGDNPLSVNICNEPDWPTVTATDNIDTDITIQPRTDLDSFNKCRLGEYRFAYTAIDSSGNSATEYLTVKVEGVEFILKGGDTAEVYQYMDEYMEPGYTVKSSYSDNVSVSRSGSVDVDTLGSYVLTYTATDTEGNTRTVTRTVTVVRNPTLTLHYASSVLELRKALEDASANGKDDVIILSSGVYTTTSDGQGSFDYNDNEDYRLKIIGNDDVILDGDDTDRVLDFDNSIETNGGFITLKYLNIRNGSSSTYTGGIDSEKYIKIYGCKIHDHRGRGIFAVSGIKLVDSEVYGNTHTGDSQYTGGGIKSNGTTYIVNSKIYDNVTEYEGGGIYSKYDVKIQNSKIYNNTVKYDFYNTTKGGGIYIQYNKESTISDSSIYNNKVPGGSGGGIYCSGGSYQIYKYKDDRLYISNSDIYSNYAGYDAGGLSTIELSMSHSSVRENNATEYGGMSVQCLANIYDSNITGNISTNSESASGINVHYWAIEHPTIIKSSIISNNKVINNKRYDFEKEIDGVGVYVSNDSSLILINNIIANNKAIFNNGGRVYGIAVFASDYNRKTNLSLLNNTIVNNTASGEDAIYGSIYGHGIVANNLLDNNDGAITFSGDSTLINNYIDYTKVINENDYTIIKRDNITPEATDIAYNADFTLPDNSMLIGKGAAATSAWWGDAYYDDMDFYNNIINRLAHDHSGNPRGEDAVDIGAYEHHQ